MANHGVEFIPFKRNDLAEIYHQRYLDWIEAGGILLRKTRIYKTAYRKKICTRCSVEQQAKRKCVKYVIKGKQLTSCGHMDSACGQKFKPQFDEYMNSHPAMFAKKMAQESQLKS